MRSREERDLAKSTVLAWFNSHLSSVREATGVEVCNAINDLYRQLIEFTDKAILRSKYDACLKDIKKELASLRKHVVLGHSAPPADTSNSPPDFSQLIGDTAMKGILRERWLECVTCTMNGAPLAATVMMGGLLETLLLTRFNREADKSKIFSAATAPQDRNTGKPLQLKEWTLRHYLDVAHELGWITKSTKEVGEVLRDFRNYVHPYKQASHGVVLKTDDARLFWEVCKEITRQLLAGK